MFSKQVARQIAEAFTIVSAVTKNADQVANSLGQHFAARLNADQPQADWKVVLDNLAQTLRETSSQLELQDVEYQNQLAEERLLRDRRDQILEKLRNQLRGACSCSTRPSARKRLPSTFPCGRTWAGWCRATSLPLAAA